MKFLLENWRPFSGSLLTVACVGLMINIGSAPVYDLAAGEGIYKTYCANCHGRDGRGNGSAADFVKDKERMSKSDEELLESIRNGFIGRRGYMPGWKDTLTEEQMNAVLDYVRTNFGGSVK